MAKLTRKEMMLWKNGTLEEYADMIRRRNWYRGRVEGAAKRMQSENDALSVFTEEEHESPAYKKHKAAYAKAAADHVKYIAKWQKCDYAVKAMQQER